MKLIIILSSFLGASLAVACPNLAGSYNCTDSGARNFRSTITQTTQNGATVYTSNRAKTVADGKSTGKETDKLVDTKVATCNGQNELEVVFNYQLPDKKYTHKVISKTNVSGSDSFEMKVTVEESDNGEDRLEERQIKCTRTS